MPKVTRFLRDLLKDELGRVDIHRIQSMQDATATKDA
jgi:hypothetical protein